MAGAARDYAKVGGSGDSRCAARQRASQEKSTNVPLTEIQRTDAPTQPWVAVGSSTTDCAPKVGRSEDDGVLLKIKIQIQGRTYVALVDSGASRNYASPDAVVEWELQGTPDVVHLELADGSKIRSTQKIPGVMCSAGKISSYEDFTVTKLLHGVDAVLGMTWLRRWNPLIDWVQQVMYIRTQHGWDRIRGLFLEKEHRIGTVKLLTDEDLASLESAPDIAILRTPQFWTYAAGASSWTNVPERGARVEEHSKFLFCHARQGPILLILPPQHPRGLYNMRGWLGLYNARQAASLQDNANCFRQSKCRSW